MNDHGKQDVRRGTGRGARRSRVVDTYPVQGVLQEKLVPGFLIVQKNGVVRMNKNYKGDPYGLARLPWLQDPAYNVQPQ